MVQWTVYRGFESVSMNVFANQFEGTVYSVFEDCVRGTVYHDSKKDINWVPLQGS